jgi:hypothetical protein
MMKYMKPRVVKSFYISLIMDYTEMVNKWEEQCRNKRFNETLGLLRRGY